MSASSAPSTRTRIETWSSSWSGILIRLRAHHPREQGLKPPLPAMMLDGILLRAHHPREQGLKLKLAAIHDAIKKPSSAPSTRTRIETPGVKRFTYSNQTSSAPSTRTRIETSMQTTTSSTLWSSSAPSTRTRIETDRRGEGTGVYPASSAPSTRTRIETYQTETKTGNTSLRAHHPREQGLKLDYR